MAAGRCQRCSENGSGRRLLERDLIETSASIIGRNTPLTLYPAVQFEALESWIKRAFFNPQQIVGQLLDQLCDGIPMYDDSISFC
jgi:hypothetical protein